MSSRRFPAEQQQSRPKSTQLISPILAPSAPHPGCTYHSEILERSRGLDIFQRFLQILQLQIDTSLRFLGILHSLCLKSLNRLDLPSKIVSRWFECAEVLLNLVHDGLVLQNGAVVCKVDLGWLFGQQLNPTAGILIALLEGLEGGGGLTSQAKGAGYFRPVELESCASLEETRC